MGKRINYSRLKKHDFYGVIVVDPAKFVMKEDLKAFLFALALMAVTTWRTIIIVPTEYEWIVWAGMGVLLAMLLILVCYRMGQWFIPAGKVVSCLNELTDEELDAFSSSKLDINSFFLKDFLVAPRAFVYYKDIVSLTLNTKLTKRLWGKKTPQGDPQYCFEYSIDIRTRSNQRWQVKSDDVAGAALVMRQLFEELLIRCDDDVQVSSELIEQHPLNKDIPQIKEVAEELLDVIRSKDEDRLYDMMMDYIPAKGYEQGQAYVFDLFKTDIISIQDFRSHTKMYWTGNSWWYFYVGRYIVTTEDDEYFMFFGYSLDGDKGQRKVMILAIAPAGEMTAKEFFLKAEENDFPMGIYYPGIEEKNN